MMGGSIFLVTRREDAKNTDKERHARTQASKQASIPTPPTSEPPPAPNTSRRRLTVSVCFHVSIVRVRKKNKQNKKRDVICCCCCQRTAYVMCPSLVRLFCFRLSFVIIPHGCLVYRMCARSFHFVFVSLISTRVSRECLHGHVGHTEDINR